MSQEITVLVGMSATKASLKVNVPTQTMRIDLSGTRWDGGAQDIGTSVEAIAFKSDLGSAGWTVFTNLDATNYVEIGPNNGSPYMVKLLAGESCVLRLDNLTMYAKANTSTVKLGFVVLEA